RGVGFLSGLRQGAGEVRDATGASGRWPAGFGSCWGTWLFAGGVLSSGGGVRPVGDGGADRRAARPSRPGGGATGDRGLYSRPGGRVGGADRPAGGRGGRGGGGPAHRRAGGRAVRARAAP